MSEIVKVENLCKKFDNVNILNNINLVIQEGEIHSLIGPNGAGKTTLLKCILGLIKPSYGLVEFYNMLSYVHREKIVNDIGVVLDDGGIYLELTGLSNLIFFAGIYSIKKCDVIKKIDEYDTIFDLKRHIMKKVKHYSKGMIQKLKILRELIHSPKILFLDEPFLYLDPIAKSDICNILMRINKNGVTIFIISHDLNEVEKVSDRITMMKEGKIYFSDIKSKILQTPIIQKYRLVVKNGNQMRTNIEGMPKICIHNIDEDVFIISKKDESINIINYILSYGIEIDELSAIKVNLEKRFMEGVYDEPIDMV